MSEMQLVGDVLQMAPTPLLILVLWVLHKFDVRLVRVETLLEDDSDG